MRIGYVRVLFARSSQLPESWMGFFALCGDQTRGRFISGGVFFFAEIYVSVFGPREISCARYLAD